VTIGHPSRRVFLAIPAEGLDILNSLAAGRTVAETVRAYVEKYAETPDIEDFLTVLAGQGFVGPHADQGGRAGIEPGPSPSGWSLNWISSGLGRRVFAAPMLCAYGLVVGVALALIVKDPRLVPGPTVLIFPHHLAALTLALLAFVLVGLTVHELGHLVAARAAGASARIGISHRLWIAVAETDMTGVWLAPKRRRYLAFLAGPIIDAVSASLLVVLLWASRRGWVGLSPVLAELAAAVLFTYLMRLLWQCFFFVRTDFYYVLATALGCKSLLADTEVFIRNAVGRLRRSPRTVDQSAIPRREMQVVRAYSLIWLTGRAVALGSLVFVTLPVLGRYGAQVARVMAGAHSRYGVVDVLTVAVLGIGLQGAGLWMWIRGFYRARTQRRSDGLAGS
jgi:hypothetical protein